MNTLHNFLFNVYPYICLAVFFMGSLARFDRDQYTWKSDSSQLLRKGQLKWGSNLFHIGILFLFGGHTVGLLTPARSASSVTGSVEKVRGSVRRSLPTRCSAGAKDDKIDLIRSNMAMNVT